MPWSKGQLLRQLREACRKGLSRVDIRELERLAREYGATREEISRAKAVPSRKGARR